MSAYIYVEGGSGSGSEGGKSTLVTIRARQAFHELLHKMGFEKKQPRLVPCGGRKEVYDRFCTAIKANQGGYVGMWIDSEEPMLDIEKAWNHLGMTTTVAKWAKPAGVADDQVFFMTTCMETWIVADRRALQAHYGPKLRINTLPKPGQLEKQDRHAVQDKLVLATKDCKNAYRKGMRSTDILKKIEPAELRKHLPSFVRAERILKKKL